MFLKSLFHPKNRLMPVLLVGGVFILFTPPVDSDFGWHFRYGEYFLQNGRILRENIFSYTMPDYAWASSYWLAQVIFAVPMLLFGNVAGPIVISLALSILTVLFYLYMLARRVPNKLGIALGSFMLFIGLSGYALPVRPMIFSTILFSALLYVLLYRKDLIKLLPLLFLLWANLHPDWMLGLFILAVYALFDLLEKRRLDLELILTGLLSGAATFFTPYLWHLHVSLLRESSQLSFITVREFLPYHALDDRFVSLAFSVGLVAVSVASLKKQLGWWYVFITVFFILMSFRFVYFYRHVFLIGLFPVALYFGELCSEFFRVLNEKERHKVKVVTFFVGTSFVLFMGTIFAVNVNTALAIDRWSVTGEYPHGAVQYLKMNPIPGNMLNDYNWGGYLIWHLPEHKTFIDGRMPAWRTDSEFLYGKYHKLGGAVRSGDKETALEILDDEKIQFLLFPKDTEFKEFLTVIGNWETVYEDDTAVIIKRL